VDREKGNLTDSGSPVLKKC